MAIKTVPPGQLDLFLDTDTTVFANESAAALMRRDPDRAQDWTRRLEAQDPGYPLLDPLRTLVQALRHGPGSASSPAEIAQAVTRLETGIEPAAHAVLGKDAPDFMAPFWHDLASLAEAHPYDSTLPQAFSAELYLRGREFAKAAAAAEAIPNRDANPNALHWLALAGYGMQRLTACLPPLLKLALVAPARLGATVDEVGDASLKHDWKAFRETLDWFGDGDPSTWFPAWYLLAHPGTPAPTGIASLPASPATEALAAIERLNALEASGLGPELIAARSRLRDVAPELFGIYMGRRNRDSGKGG